MTETPASLGRRDRKKAATRRSISETATRLFLESGFDEVTVKQVAEAADVSPTTVFTYFPTKEALVFDEDPDHQVALAAAVRDRSSGTTVLDALEAHLGGGRLARGHDEDPQIRAFLALVDATPALRDYERRMLLRHESALAEVIAATTDLSAVRALGLARFVLQAVDVARDRPDPARALTELFDMLRHGSRV